MNSGTETDEEPRSLTMYELKACPFCGHDMSCATWIGNASDSLEQALGPMYAQRSDAIEAWNTRPPNSERLVEALEDCRTHRDVWRNAITLTRDFACEGSEDPEADRLYWSHELRAFERTFAALLSNGVSGGESK